MAEEEVSFKVTDRRRGQDPPASSEPEVPSRASTPVSSAPSSQDVPPRSEAQARPLGAEAMHEAQPLNEAQPGEAPPVSEDGDLSGLFMMFASSALINLGEAADPSTGERRMDVDQARDA